MENTLAKPQERISSVTDVLYTYVIDRQLPPWARRSNPIVRRHLGGFWKMLTPNFWTVGKIYLAQVAVVMLSLPFPFIFTILMPTVTVSIVLIPTGLAVYAQAIFLIIAASAQYVADERRNNTMGLLLAVPHPTLHILYSKAAAAVWRHVENLGLLMLAMALFIPSLLIIQYDIYFGEGAGTLTARLTVLVVLASVLVRLLLEPMMAAALGALMGAVIPSRVSAAVAGVLLMTGYFAFINIPRLLPLSPVARILVDAVLPVVLPIVIGLASFRAAAHALRD